MNEPQRLTLTLCTSTEDYTEILNDPTALRAVLDGTLTDRLEAERVTEWEHIDTSPAISPPGTFHHTYTCFARPVWGVAA
jgi:hypothetical protein